MKKSEHSLAVWMKTIPKTPDGIVISHFRSVKADDAPLFPDDGWGDAEYAGDVKTPPDEVLRYKMEPDSIIWLKRRGMLYYCLRQKPP